MLVGWAEDHGQLKISCYMSLPKHPLTGGGRRSAGREALGRRDERNRFVYVHFGLHDSVMATERLRVFI